MDSDEFDDDIADEDLIVAATQPPTRPPLTRIRQERVQSHIVPVSRGGHNVHSHSSTSSVSLYEYLGARRGEGCLVILVE
jgi:hypothetical protein